MDTYKIVRSFFNSNISKRTIIRGLSLEEAQAHCHNPETSSSTCTKSAGKVRTRKFGKWFDGYTAE